MAYQEASLPSGYTSLPNVMSGPEKMIYTVAGFVTDTMAPTRTARGDFMITFSVCDPDFMISNGNWAGARARFFKKAGNDLPEPAIGDVMLIRNITKSVFRGTSILLSNWNTTYAIFGMQNIPDPVFSAKYETGATNINGVWQHPSHAPNADEQRYIMALKQRYGAEVEAYVTPRHVTPRHHGSAPSGPTVPNPGYTPAPSNAPPVHINPTNPPSGPRAMSRVSTYKMDKFSLIENVQPNKFYDMLVEVVKISPVKYQDFIDIYVTDYTINKQMFDYATPDEQAAECHDGDEYGYLSGPPRDWPGPWGQRTLRLEIKHPHLPYVQQHVREHHFVHLSNVRTKISRQAKLEGNLWADSKWPGKILVDRVNPIESDRGKDLLARRDNYWQSKKRTLDASNDETYKGKSKKRKKASDRAQELSAAQEKLVDGLSDVHGVHCNKHVRSSNAGVPLTTIASLLDKRGRVLREGNYTDLPFLNQRRRCQVRVVDFYPPRLEDFTSLKSQFDNDSANQSIDVMSVDEPAWQWDFYFLVEDSVRSGKEGKSELVPRIWIHVPNSSGQYLLKLDARNLTQDRSLLNALRQKLDIVCGNLTELKEAQEGMVPSHGQDLWGGKLSNLPFDCCIQEYGQRLDDDDHPQTAQDGVADGWIRLFSLFETVVL
ncbi:hypothetical protein CAC42_2995 [Sphaceloma murrayae]|uniref:Protection of telomeres protein 1 n=1 Tax=Sphaceloma murrayae TaxID=2082308 RepID=A0A2K1QRP0_9PEZI|nr:hypothetical protein CAC42_2995 [Sphaceloma murrayae]